MPTTFATIQLRRDTAANWTSANPVLVLGEAGLETDTGLFKIGDGSTAWNSLGYSVAKNLATATTGAGTPTASTDSVFGLVGGVLRRALVGSWLDDWTNGAMGAISRTLRSRVGDGPSVKDFGATGDGSTNDRAAFAALPAGVWLVPPGTYVIGTSLTLATGVQLLMQGSVLAPASGQTLTLGSGGLLAHFGSGIGGLGTVAVGAGTILDLSSPYGAVAKIGDTMTGPLVLPAPTLSGHATNKAYVDGRPTGSAFSLTSFGCACDGVTDDSGAISALLPGAYYFPSVSLVKQLYVPIGVSLSCGPAGYPKLDTTVAIPKAPQILGSLVWPQLGPRVLGGKGASLGSSLPGRGINGNQTPGNNFFPWLNAVTRGVILWEPSLNVGGSNQDVTYTDSQIDALVAAGMAPWAYWILNVNSLNPPVTPYTTYQWAFYIVNGIFRLLSLGCRPIIMLTPPRAGAQWADAATRATGLSLNELMRSLAPKLGDVIVIDPRRKLVDPASATGDPLANMTEDTVHPADRGGAVAALDQGPQLLAEVAGSASGWVGLDVPVSAADRYTASTADGGNLASTAMLTGTTGTLNGSAAGANVPTGVVVVTSNITVTPTIVARTDGYPGNKMRLSYSAASPSNGTVTVTFPVDLPPVGAKMRASLDVAAVFGGLAAAAIDDVALSLVLSPAASPNNPVVAAWGVNNAGDWSGRLYTPECVVPASIASASLQCLIHGGTLAGSRVIDLSAPALRIVPSASPPLVASTVSSQTPWSANSTFVLPTNMTFSRGSAGWARQGASYAAPSLAQVATGTPRWEWLPSSTVGWLMEGARVQEVPDTGFTSGTVWDNTTTVTTGVADPFGGTGAVRITGANTTVITADFINYTTTGARRSIWARSTTGQGAKTGAILRRCNDALGPLAITETWTRFDLAPTTLNASNQFVYGMDFRSGTSQGTAISVELYCPMNELNSDFPGSPILTTGVGFTRSVEIASRLCALPATAFATVHRARTAAGIGSQEGNQYLWQADDGTTTNRLVIYKYYGDGHLYVERYSGGSAAGSISASINGGTVLTTAGGSLDMGALANATEFGLAINWPTPPSGIFNERWGRSISGNSWSAHILKGPPSPTVWLAAQTSPQLVTEST